MNFGREEREIKWRDRSGSITLVYSPDLMWVEISVNHGDGWPRTLKNQPWVFV